MKKVYIVMVCDFVINQVFSNYRAAKKHFDEYVERLKSEGWEVTNQKTEYLLQTDRTPYRRRTEFKKPDGAPWNIDIQMHHVNAK